MRKVKVDMGELIFAFTSGFEDISQYLDLETGEIVLTGTDDPDCDMAEEVDADPDRYLLIPSDESRDGYRDMADFAETVKDQQLQGMLAVALNGKGAFRRFKDVLYEYPDEQKRWYKFSEERVKERVLEWLWGEEIEVEE